MAEVLKGEEQTEILANEAATARTKAVEELNKTGGTPQGRAERAVVLFEQSANYYKDAGVSHQAMVEYAVTGSLSNKNDLQERCIQNIEELGKAYGYERYVQPLVAHVKNPDSSPGGRTAALLMAESRAAEMRKLEKENVDPQKLKALKQEFDGLYVRAGLGRGFGDYR